jgi:putative hemolysin
MVMQIILIVFLTAINALFVMAEMSIVSVRESRLQELMEAGDRRAKIVLDMLKSPEYFLSTIQTVITLIGILSGALGGATLAEELAPFFQSIPILANHASAISFIVVVFFITFLSLILGELVPKRWALGHSEVVALNFARPLKTVMMLVYPVVKMFSVGADLTLKILRIPIRGKTPVSEEEIKIMLEHGEKAGVVEEAEKEMIERVFRLGDRRVDSLMTHRTDIIWIDINQIADDKYQNEALKTMAESGHIIFPVCRETIDEVIGVVSIKHIWYQLVERGKVNIQEIIEKPMVVPGTIGATDLLERFRENKQHLALIVDEYGSLDGLVTINDIVQAVMGDLPSADQEEEPLVVEREDGTFLLDGRLPFADFQDLLSLSELDEETKGNFQTLAGFVLSYLGRFPAVGEKFEWSNHIFEIVDMDGHRVDRVLVKPPSSNQAEDEESINSSQDN